MNTDRLWICEGCGGAAMAAALGPLVPQGMAVSLTPCMNVCGQPVTVAFRAGGKAAYLFAGVDPVVQMDEVAAFARLYAASGDGMIGDVRPCGDLRFRLIGRIPA